MATALVDRLVRPTLASSCAACGVVMDSVEDSGDNICPMCGTNFCTSCHSLKKELEFSSADRSYGKYCVTCEQIIGIKKTERSRNKNKHRGTTNVIPQEKPFLQIKPPCVKEKQSNLQDDLHTEDRFSSDSKMDDSTNSTSHGEKNQRKTYLFAIQFCKAPNLTGKRFLGERNERGLASKSNVPNAVDNRYYYLNSPGKTANDRPNLMETVDKRNFYAGTNLQPRTLLGNWLSSKAERQHENRPRVKSNDSFDRNKEFDERKSSNRPKENQSYNNTDKFEKGVSKGSPGINQRNSQLYSTAKQFVQEMPTMGIQGLPPDSQFHAKTINYPTSSAGYFFTPKSQTSDVGKSYQQSHSGLKNSHYQRKMHDSKQKTSHKAMAASGAGRSSHSVGNKFLDDPLFVTYDDLHDLDDLDDVPAYGDIPFALLITGSVDEKTLRRAKQKQIQQDVFDRIKEQSGKTKAGEKINKNENPDVQLQRDRNEKPDTYEEQKLVDGKQYRKENPPKEKNYYGTRNVDPQFDVVTIDQNVESSDGKWFPKSSSKSSNDRKASVSSFEDEPEKGLMESSQISEHDKKIERSLSPVDVSYKETDIRQVPKALTGGKLDIQENKDEHVVNEFHEMQPPTEKETESFIREKRLEKLKSIASEISDSKMTSDVMKNRKPDNRDVAFNKDVAHKSVKSTAFRSKVPNFSDNTLRQKDTDNPEANHHRNGTTATNISDKAITIYNQGKSGTGNNSRLSSLPDQQPIAMKLLKKGTSASSRQSQEKLQTCTYISTSKPDKMTEVKKALERRLGMLDIHSEKELSANPDEEPYVMTEHRRQTKERGHVDEAQSTERSDDEELVEPAAMRLLRKSIEANESQRAMEEAFSDTRTRSSAALVSFISAAFGMASQENALNDSETAALKPKQRNKNKNKGLTQLKLKANDTISEITKDIESTGGSLGVVDDEKQSEKDMKKENESQVVPMSRTRNMLKKKPVALAYVADNRHRAFRKLKMTKSEDRLKCTSCGRPECKSHNIQKLKEIIRMAKQAGFEVRDVSPDGNCMFAAVVDQLQLYGDFRFGPKSLREAAVTWLIENPLSDDGTHYSSFCSEKWEVYLQRMIVEGEWGDHVILRAVVEIVGHTVKILNISGDESHWTILEPASIDASKDGMHLVLGHVGEFHYTSLRPADGNSSFVPASPMSPEVQDPLMTDDNGQVALEGTETVEMFREDYIDTWSDIPTVHFSYLLKHVIPIKVLDTAAILQSQYTDNLTSTSQRLTLGGIVRETSVECGGNVIEGVYVPALYAPVSEASLTRDVYNAIVFAVFEDFHVMQKKTDGPRSGKDNLVVDTTGVHIGYTKLLRTQSFPDSLGEYSAYQPKLYLEGSLDHLKQYCAIRCPFWPECAQPWKSRLRREGFPSKDIISSIESDGCLLVPNSHKESKSPDIEWQFSFDLCQKKLFRDAVSNYQKYCYILFDALCSQTMRHLESISSEHLKSVFFYACERIPVEYWESSPGACIFYMLDELLRYVKNKNLPNYFVHANNMVDYLLEKDLKEIQEQILLLRSQPVLFLQQINENLLWLLHGNSVIDKVSDDIPNFKVHKSLKRSTIEVFVPTTIGVAHDYIRKRKYAEGYEILSQAFQERLSVSTCDDSVPFQIFLPGAVSGLDLDSLVWFSAYTDKQLAGQLSKSLVRETCGDLSLVKIKEILPADVVGSYGNTEVPVEFTKRLCSFCYDFARFLFQINKHSEILPVLYHCHDVFMKKLENADINQVVRSKRNEKQPEMDDFDDDSMFYIYAAMFNVYKKQGQMEFFRSMMPVVDALVKRIHTRGAYECLLFMYKSLKDRNNSEKTENMYLRLPEEPFDEMRVSIFNSWRDRLV